MARVPGKLPQNYKMAASFCKHERTDHISGDLICLNCGYVLQANSMLSSEPCIIELPQDKQRIIKFSSVPVQLKQSPTHEAKSLSDLQALAANIISAFALKSSYEGEALSLMTKYWEANNRKVRFGKAGNRLLITCLFLLARRDHLAVNFSTLAESIQSNRFECGQFVNSLIQLDPSLRTLANPVDFSEHEVSTLLHRLSDKYGLVVLEPKIHDLSCKARKASSLLTDAGSSASSQSVALAAAWIVVDAFVNSDKQMFHDLLKEGALELAVKEIIDGNSTLSLRKVSSNRKALISGLLEIGKSSIPSTFGSLRASKTRQYSLLLSCLDEVLVFVNK